MKPEKTIEQIVKPNLACDYEVKYEDIEEFNNSVGSPTFSNVSEEKNSNFGADLKSRVICRSANILPTTSVEVGKKLTKPAKNCLL